MVFRLQTVTWGGHTKGVVVVGNAWDVTMDHNCLYCSFVSNVYAFDIVWDFPKF